MSALVLLLLASVDGGVAAPLREGAPAPRLTFQVGATASEKPCTFERRDFTDARVRMQWLARCPQLRAPWLRFDAKAEVAAVKLFAQFWTDTVLAFSPKEAAAFSPAQRPPWVPSPVVEVLQARAAGAAGFEELAVDERDGARLGYRYQYGYLRLERGGEQQPLFERSLPEAAATPRHALLFDRDPKVKTPWLLYAPDPWRKVELRLRSPAGEERLLYERPARQHGGSYRVELLQAVRLPQAALPTILLQADYDLLLFTPRSDAADAEYQVRVLPGPRVGLPTTPPRGESGALRADGRCSDTKLEDREEALFDPQLVLWKGRLLVVFISEETRSGLHFGAVNRVGKTPAEDRLGCEWVVDTRSSEVSLVVGELDGAGLHEWLRTPIEIAPGPSFHGSTNAVAREGDRLAVSSSSHGLITVTVFDLPKVLSAAK